MSRPNIVNLELEDMATYCGKDSNTEKYIETLESEVERLRASNFDNVAWFKESERERDQLAAEVEALTPYRDNHHDLIRHMADHDAEVIERAINECAHKTLEGEVIYVECIREYANQLRQQAKEHNYDN
jgi:chromosome segregation ATPase